MENETIRTRMVKARDGYILESGKKRYYATNWHFTPDERFIFEETNDVLIRGVLTIYYSPEDKENYPIVLDMKLFNTMKGLKEIHPEAMINVPMMFIGVLKSFVMGLARSSKCPTHRALSYAGVIKYKDKFVYCHQGYTTGDIIAFPNENAMAILRTSLMEKDAPMTRLDTLLTSVLMSHHSYIPATMLCWCAAVMAKRFSMMGIKTPILFSIGRHNSGKTALHKKLIGNFFYMISPEQEKSGQKEATMHNLSGQSIATLQRLASLSNMHPLMLDEFKYQKDESLRMVMSDFLRNAYDEADVQKAFDSTGKMNTFKNVRPITMTGESSFKSEGAIINRSIQIRHKSFTEQQTKLHHAIKWEGMRYLGQRVLQHLLKEQSWTWASYSSDPKWEIDTRNADAIEFLENGRRLINTVVGQEILTEDLFKEVVREYLTAIKSEDFTDAEELFGQMESFFLNNQHIYRRADPKKIILKKGDLLYVSFRPFARWLEKSKISTNKQALTEVLLKVGMIRHVPYPPREMSGYSMVFSFDWLEFKSKIQVYDYPNLFKNIDLTTEINPNINFNEV
jgi:hypothetical protein